MTTITALPSPPSRQDPTNFNDRADAFLGALPAFATEANAQAVEVNTASANAVAANQAVIAATNITKWVSGTTYANGAVVWSPINGLAYRRITASGSGTTDPSLDSTNYKQVNGTGDVSTSGNQTISGDKTFTGTTSMQSVTVTSITGTGAEQSGMVAYFAMTTAPSGWLKANGAAVSRTTYASLFAAIGTTFGIGNGTTTFNLPDLRAEFIRGLDDGRGIESRTIGSAQLDAFQGHEHQLYDVRDGGGGGYNGSGSVDWTRNTQAIVQKSGYSTPRVADETRPRNIALLACIKY